ncbi:MAG TPA: spore protease YyaC [Clostridiales bacterium]|nr:spore protease YyaC [Clostridiales bacterium]
MREERNAEPTMMTKSIKKPKNSLAPPLIKPISANKTAAPMITKSIIPICPLYNIHLHNCNILTKSRGNFPFPLGFLYSLERMGNNSGMNTEKTVIVCIGSDRVSGDMLGPLVGSSLREEYALPCPVYGAVGASVNGINLEEYLCMIRQKHKGCPIIAVDAALGKKEDVGRVRLKKGGIKAGGALDRKGERIGDIGVVGVVAEERAPDEVYNALLAVPFPFVQALAQRIAGLIHAALFTVG